MAPHGEWLNILIYQHLRSNVCEKLASKFCKATDIDLEKDLPENCETLSEIFRLYKEKQNVENLASANTNDQKPNTKKRNWIDEVEEESEEEDKR